jgi:alkanesulfonate monooxygenase SsuD/methylene tetrahydromethanopterin reductase-like flavin-dependent oxidoreductase (luciferase family)
MDFGLLMAFRNPRQWQRPIDQIYREHLEQAVLAEELGFDHIWITEHHFMDDEWTPSLLPLLAAIAARTSRIRIGTFIMILPFHNPIRVAEDASTVDIISGGRFDLGVGPGGVAAHEYETFGIPLKQRRPRTFEGLEIIRRCFTEDCFSFKGRFHQLADVRMTPKPIQKPHPPLWVAAVGEKALCETAAAGYHLAGSGTPAHQQTYDEALHRAGRNPADYQIAQLRMIHLSETRDKAWDEVENQLHYTLNWYFAGIADASDKYETLARDFKVPALPPPRELRNVKNVGFFVPAIVGTPDDAVRALDDYFKETRVTHMSFWMHLPGMDPRHTARSMELFAHEVIPHFRGKQSASR